DPRDMRPFLAFFLRLTIPLVLLAAPVLPREAAAATPEAVHAPRPHAYAIVVGSNTGGEGQEPLHYAEDDAHRFAEVLTQLGHYDASDVTVLMHPDPAHVMGAIDAVSAKVRASAAQGEEAQVVFYYSG